MRGFLFAADLTGYTAFMTASELDHASGLVRELMAVVADALGPPLTVVKYEGDALLGYVADDALRDRVLLLDALEQAYMAFADHLFNIGNATSCRCRACANVSSLDLKLFLHHGEFMASGTSGEMDLAGLPVILLHRLMKNRVAAEAEIEAYLLATAAALDRLGRPGGFTPHPEEYEHFGRVDCGVADLRAALESRRNAREIRVDPSRALVVCEAVVHAPPPVVWDCFFDPMRRMRWDSMFTGVEGEPNEAGREGPGAAIHCVHGRAHMVAVTVDWKPFRYFTQEYRAVSGFFPFHPLLITVETTPSGDGATRVVLRYDSVAGNPIRRFLLRTVGTMMSRRGTADLAGMDAMLAEERAAAGPDAERKREAAATGVGYVERT